jgi:FtsZ-interacting cell division protein ZipA
MKSLDAWWLVIGLIALVAVLVTAWWKARLKREAVQNALDGEFARHRLAALRAHCDQVIGGAELEARLNQMDPEK